MFDPESGIFELDPGEPLVLLLGSIGHEGILSTLRAAGRQYKNKFLESRAQNWKSILQYFEDYVIEGVLVKLSPNAISLIVSEEYDEVRENLFKEIGGAPNIVFVYEDLLSGHFDSDVYHQPSEEARSSVFELLDKYDIQIMPYKGNAEVTVMAEKFLAETEQNLIFRLYVPSGRIWSNEADKFLQLFRGYLEKVEKLNVRLGQYRTDRGVIYEIYSEEVTSNTGIETEFSEFTQFMDLCVTNPSTAENILKSKVNNPRDVISIIAQYSKEAKRLSIDLKHEREQKILSIRQRLESELVDTIPGATDWDAINLLVNMTVPVLNGTKNAIFLGQLPDPQITTNITINMNPQIVETVNGVIAQEIRGDQHIGPEAQQLLELIQKHEGKDSRELASSVHELEDTSVPKASRLNAKQKLKMFLIGIGKSAGNVGVGLLQSYIEKKLGI